MLWERLLHPTLDKNFRKNLSYRADALIKELKASPHQEAVDLDVRAHLEKTAHALFMVLVKERRGAALPDVDAFTKLSTEDADKARSEAKIWLLELESALIEIKLAADEAYRAYPQEKDAYEVGEMVTSSVTEHAAP
ncbi:MAG TPA: hypothetical protein VFU98_10475 [Microlunatus sp.]|nr:hypothetical protein [Microlunatus sp.]